MPSSSFNLDNYVPVSERVEKFRADHPTWGLNSLVQVDDGRRVVVRAVVTDETGRLVASGHAEEIRGEGPVNKTSAMENAETSAWGRALANMGYEVKRGIASREEMGKAARGPQEPVATSSDVKALVARIKAAPASVQTELKASMAEANLSLAGVVSRSTYDTIESWLPQSSGSEEEIASASSDPVPSDLQERAAELAEMAKNPNDRADPALPRGDA